MDVSARYAHRFPRDEHMRSFLVRILPILLFAVAIISPAAEAKTSGRISGKVTTKSGQSLLGAIITVFKQDQDGGTISFTRSDRQGGYALANLTPGSYYLQVSREGYHPITSSAIKIDPGKTTTLNIILQEFMDFVSGEPDARNWDLKSVIRSTSDRRLIFRDLQATAPMEAEDPFERGATLNVASTSGLSSDSYAVSPSSGQTGIVSNFAFTEPVTDHARMIFSGQLNSGYDSYWQVRNTYNYRPTSDRDMKFSVGYGRMTLNGPSLGTISRPVDFFDSDPQLRESGVQTLGLGFSSSNKVMDTISLEYGFDLSRLYSGSTKSFFSPFFQIILTPADNWTFRTALASRRLSDNNSIALPGGDVLNLMEPTYIADIDGQVHVSQFKHSEVALGRILNDATNVEVAAYEDRMNGPGLPIFLSSTGQNWQGKVAQLTEAQSAQRGVRIAMNRKFLDCLTGSIAYVYGSGANLAGEDPRMSSELLARHLLDYVQRSYYHSLTTRLNAVLPRTQTNITAVIRWYPGSTLTPIDLFGDRSDMMSKGANFIIRQPIPLPEFLGSTRRWEALVDVRNLFDQNLQRVQTADGDIILTRNPRSLRFGLNLNLY
jgi:hypothetical protein